jgi:hypothetical protein
MRFLTGVGRFIVAFVSDFARLFLPILSNGVYISKRGIMYRVFIKQFSIFKKEDHVFPKQYSISKKEDRVFRSCILETVFNF